MKKYNTSVPELVGSILANPEKSFREFVNESKQMEIPDSFWKEFHAFDYGQLGEVSLETFFALRKLEALEYFHNLKSLPTRNISEVSERIIRLKPCYQDLVRAAFIPIRFNYKSLNDYQFHNNSKEELKAIKQILKELRGKTIINKQSNLSLELVIEVSQLVKLKHDLISIENFEDLLTLPDFQFDSNAPNGFLISLRDGLSKKDSPYIQSFLKTKTQISFEKEWVQPEISNELHFSRIDSTLRTYEGLGVMGGQNVEILAKPEGVTNLGSIKEIPKQNFHYYYRQVLSKIYHPTDEINIHDKTIHLGKNIYVSIYQLICAMSCLVAQSQILKYQEQLKKYIQSSYLEGEVISNRETTLKGIEVDEIQFLSEDEILEVFYSISEFEDIELPTIMAILGLFSKKNQMDFNAIYCCGTEYFLDVDSCVDQDFNRMLYNLYISNNLFRSKEFEADKVRERRINQSISEMLVSFSLNTRSNLEYKLFNDSVRLDGEFDVVAYTVLENTFFIIQTKLRNIPSRDESDKLTWGLKNVQLKAVEQIKKDIKLISCSSGIEFLKEQLGIPKEVVIENPRIYPLIITDNFYEDHKSYVYNEQGDQVTTISFFELKCLLRGVIVDAEQEEIGRLKPETLISQLSKIIETNQFWSFISKRAEAFTEEKSLLTINKEGNVSLRI